MTTPRYESLQAMFDHLAGLSAKPAHVRTICRSWLGRGSWECPRDSKFPKAVLDNLDEIKRELGCAATVRSVHPAGEETARLLLDLRDGQTIESVLLPKDGVCVSSQLGCAVGCRFCMTGQGGLHRQLSDIEIVAQTAIARSMKPKTKKVVFMGMGEPSHNLENVWSAMRFMALYGEFAYKELVISTVGDERLFARLLAEKEIRPALAVSLHTIDDDKRRHLVPRGSKMKVDEIVARAESYARHCNYPTQYQWTLLKGVNDSIDEMTALAAKIKGHYAMVNLIPLNAVEGSEYERPDWEYCWSLIHHLRSLGVVATLRDSAAQEVDGGCGQLRARILKEKKRV